MFAYGFPIFSQKKISDAVFSMTYEMRAGEYIPLKMIDVFDERLLNVGFYSHHQAEKYDRKVRGFLRIYFPDEQRRAQASAEHFAVKKTGGKGGSAG